MEETHVIYTLAIPQEHLRVIGAALNEMPYRVAAPVIAALQEQVSAIDAQRAKNAEAHMAKQMAPPGPHALEPDSDSE